MPDNPEDGVVMVRVGEMVKERCTCGAALNVASPLWLALIVQVPAETSVTVVPETVQVLEVADVKVTESPLEAVAEILKAAIPNVLLDIELKVIV